MILRIVITSTSLPALICGHDILDNNPHFELHLITEGAEVGLLNEGPGILSSPFDQLIPQEWIHNLRNQHPSEHSSAVRRSWLERAMASKLAERGATLHLRTNYSVIEDSTRRTLQLSGAGVGTGTRLEADHILDFPEVKTRLIWMGGVHMGEPNNREFEGCRPDGSVEVWWRKGEDEPLCYGSWVQSMEWIGEDPREAIVMEIEEGRSLAASIL